MEGGVLRGGARRERRAQGNGLDMRRESFDVMRRGTFDVDEEGGLVTRLASIQSANPCLWVQSESTKCPNLICKTTNLAHSVRQGRGLQGTRRCALWIVSHLGSRTPVGPRLLTSKGAGREREGREEAIVFHRVMSRRANESCMRGRGLCHRP